MTQQDNDDGPMTDTDDDELWNRYRLIDAAALGDLDTIKDLITIINNPIDEEGDNVLDEALGRAAETGHLDIVKFLAEIPEVDPTWDDNNALLMAIIGRANLAALSVIKFLLAIGAYDNKIITQLETRRINRGKIYDKRIIALLVATNLLAKTSAITEEDILEAKKEIEKEMARYLLPYVMKICTTLRDLSAPEQIEILDNLAKYAINMPYHIKWKMITRCKHFR